MKDESQKPFSFRIIAINDELPAVANEEDALVIFGLAKPYRGSSCQCTRWRCYILVTGLLLASCTHLTLYIQQQIQSESTVVSRGRRIDLYFLVSTQMTLKACLPIGKNRIFKRTMHVKNKLGKHWRENSVNEQIEILLNRLFITRDLVDVQIVNEVPLNETNFETNVS